MDQSAFEALITGTFIVIFVVAISTTIFLFREIIDFSDRVFDASNKITGDSVLVLDGVNTANKDNIIRGVDALAYVTNYGCYNSSGTYVYSPKYAENFDTKIRVRLEQTNGSLTNVVNTMGYYKLNVQTLQLDGTIIVQLKQYTKAQVDAM